MKKTLSIMIMAAALLLMTQCRKDEMPAVMPETNTVSMTVTAGPGSKTDITPAGAIKWSDNDKIYVGHNGTYVGYLTLVSSAGSATGTFSGDVALTGITDGTEQTFHFYYLGSAERTLAVGDGSAEVDFSSQNIYNNDGKLENANAQHVGYGSASGTVKDGVVTGINVTLVSKVALARFSFKKDGADYTDALTLSGDKIYNSMTVGFGGTFNGKTEGNISLTGGHAERYVMLVPAGTDSKTLNFVGGDMTGSTKLENGIEANKFYGKTEPIAVTLTASAPTHEYVDLGLPSGLLWATCNLGASKPEEYGDYYQWGGVESVTSTEIDVGWAGCPFTIGTYGSGNKKVFTKYIPTGMPEYWAGEGDPDNKLVLESTDDAATVAWGSGWRMPTEAEFTELINNTTQTWYAKDNTEFNGVAGYKCVSKKEGYTDKYIFLPAAGCRNETSFYDAVSHGYYWSSSLEMSRSGRYLFFYLSCFFVSYNYRYYGCTVRPVCPPQN